MKRVILVSLLIAVFVLSGCTGGSTQRESNIDYRTGSQGLELQFLQGNPPTRMYEGDKLALTVEYTNKGAFGITNGRLYLSGYDRQYVTLIPDRVENIVAEGKSQFNPLGQISNVATFTDERVGLPEGGQMTVDSLKQTFKVTACYKYRTIAVAQICIDPDPFSVAPEEKVCITHDVSMGTQGAPVAVTSAEEDVSRDRVQFKIHVSNVGSGTVIAPDSSINECHIRLERDDIDMVKIKARFSDKELKCQPELIRLTGGSGFSFCSYQGALGNEAYQTLLNVELDYGYRNSIQKDVEIVRLP